MNSSSTERRTVLQRGTRISKSEPVIHDHSNRQSEAELALYRQALERARADMQAFAYSVSHDLRAPLRAIQGFSKILLEDYTGKLDGEAHQFLQHIIQNVQQLSAQMDDLLRFSRAGKSSPSRIPIDTDSFLADVIEQSRFDFPPNFQVERQSLPSTMVADPVLMRQAFTELLNNAVKFTAKNPQPRLIISGREDEHAVTLTFRDNGVGFDPAHAGKLFHVFQKLHSPADFPGNGIGLAIVKRIVEAHGGCVEATARPKEGAEFSLALPTDRMRGPLQCVPPPGGQKPPLL